MIDVIRQQAAKFVARKVLKPQEFSARDFSSIFKRSFAFLVLMPKDEKDFRHAVEVLKFLKDNKKTVFILTYDHRVSLLPPLLKTNVIEHGINDMNKLELPGKKLLKKLSGIHFDVIIDTNREEQLFYNYISNSVKSAIRIGFARSDSDKYFNFQIVNNESNPESSYHNLLNCLKLF